MAQAILTFGLKFGDNIKKVTFGNFDNNQINQSYITNRIKDFNNSADGDEPFTSFKSAICDSDGTAFDKIESFSIQSSTETELI